MTNICWEPGRGWPRAACTCPASPHDFDVATGAVYGSIGRTRSGSRWFWIARLISDDVVTHHGRADTEQDAMAAARREIATMAGSTPTVVSVWHSTARDVLREVNAEKRRARPPSEETDAAAVEYLYGLRWYDGDPYVTSFRITRKTPKRIYYVRRAGWPGEDPVIGFVNRQKLETDGEVYNGGVHWCSADYHLYLAPPDLTRRAPAPALTLSELRAAMADAHPDRGGDPDEFIRARAAYVAARRAGGAA